MNSCVSLISDRRIILFIFTCWFYNSNSFAQNDSAYVTIGEIRIDGNKRTQDRIILRELLKKSGDTIHSVLNKTFLIRSFLFMIQ
jgi:hypothetical protein